MWTIRSSFVIVRRRLQRQDDNINFIATRLTSIDTTVMDSPPNWFDGDDRSEEVSLQTLAFGAGERPKQAHILAGQPRAHNYR